jgi:serine/threonine protein kinase
MCHSGGVRSIYSSVIDENGAKQISRQLLDGVKYMHEAGYAHFDLKPTVSHLEILL